MCDYAEEFKEDLSDQGTVLDDIRDYTPQFNESAERNIRTVVNMMRSM